MIELITKKPIGILPLLDEELVRALAFYLLPPEISYFGAIFYTFFLAFDCPPWLAHFGGSKHSVSTNLFYGCLYQVVPRGSDGGFLNKMHEHHMKNPVYQKVLDICTIALGVCSLVFIH